MIFEGLEGAGFRVEGGGEVSSTFEGAVEREVANWAVGRNVFICLVEARFESHSLAKVRGFKAGTGPRQFCDLLQIYVHSLKPLLFHVNETRNSSRVRPCPDKGPLLQRVTLTVV